MMIEFREENIAEEDLQVAFKMAMIKAKLPIEEYRQAMEAFYNQLLVLFEGDEEYAQHIYRKVVIVNESLIRHEVSEPWNSVSLRTPHPSDRIAS